MARKTKEDAEKTRESLLTAATTLFYQKGVSATSLQDIATEAGVTRGAVYWHFKDKMDLLHVLADSCFLPHEDLLGRLVSQEWDNPLSVLHQSCLETLGSIAQDFERRRVFTVLTQRCEYVEEMSRVIARHNACREHMRERITSIFEQAHKKKQLAPIWSPHTAALALQSMVVGFIHTEMEWEEPSHTRDLARQKAITAFFKALGYKEKE